MLFAYFLYPNNNPHILHMQLQRHFLRQNKLAIHPPLSIASPNNMTMKWATTDVNGSYACSKQYLLENNVDKSTLCSLARLDGITRGWVCDPKKLHPYERGLNKTKQLSQLKKLANIVVPIVREEQVFCQNVGL